MDLERSYCTDQYVCTCTVTAGQASTNAGTVYTYVRARPWPLIRRTAAACNVQLSRAREQARQRHGDVASLN
jgi:hypothetical protein